MTSVSSARPGTSGRCFSEYLAPGTDLMQLMSEARDSLGLSSEIHRRFQSTFGLLDAPGYEITREHCIRVGLLCLSIARCEALDRTALWLAGTLHDLGKVMIDPDILNKTDNWTHGDQETMKQHVVFGHELLKKDFPFVADIVARHHRFQSDSYPEVLPPYSSPFSAETQEKIRALARIVALADCYDALHRRNMCHSSHLHPLSGEEIRAKMFDLNPDAHPLLSKLFQLGIFTTKIF